MDSVPLIEVQDNVAAGHSPFDGSQHVELDAFVNSNMIQSVSTFIGQVFDLSFAYSPRPRVLADSNGIDVLFDGVLLASLTGNGSTQTTWTVFNHVVTATGTSASLEFRATGISDAQGGYLDAVSLSPRDTTQPVPEPTTLVLLATGFAAGVCRRARKPRGQQGLN